MADIKNDNQEDFEGKSPWARVIFVLVLIFILIGLGYWLYARNLPKTPNVKIPIETARSVYLATQSEIHTGRRLARLEDYLTQYPNSTAYDIARIRRDILRTHEHSAWAEFTKAWYNLDLNEQDKDAVLSDYLANWGTLSRTADIAALNTEVPDESILSFQTPISKYADTEDAVMAGPENTSRIAEFTPPLPPKPLQNPVANLVVRPKVRSNRTPRYPRAAKRKGIHAVVVLSLDIDDQGRVRQAHLISVDTKSYHKDFTKAAIRAARRTRFYPATQGNKAVPTAGYLRTYRFEIDQ